MSDCKGETKLRAFEGDMRDGDFLIKCCRGASIVFHIASIIDIKDSVEYSEIFGVNVKGKAVTNPPKAYLIHVTSDTFIKSHKTKKQNYLQLKVFVFLYH